MLLGDMADWGCSKKCNRPGPVSQDEVETGFLSGKVQSLNPCLRMDRVVWLAFGTLALAVAAFALYQQGPDAAVWLPGCTFHKFTGLNCPGCGMTRAAYATLHGRIGDAFRMNPVGMILLPLASIGLGIEVLGWVRGKPLPFRLKIGARGAWVIVWVLIGFCILRNIPIWPFVLLGPP